MESIRYTPHQFAQLAKIYQAADRESERLGHIHEHRLKCGRGCSGCCTDGISVFEIEAAYLREQYANWLPVAVPHPPGACAFLDEQGACRVYAHRPYVCRTQGLPLRWLAAPEEGMPAVEYRDICPLNEEGEPIESLPAAHCLSTEPFEQALAALQFSADQGQMRRVELRELFRQ